MLWIAVGKSKMASSWGKPSFCRGSFPAVEDADLWWTEFNAHQRSLVILRRNATDSGRWAHNCTLSMDKAGAEYIKQVVGDILAAGRPSAVAAAPAQEPDGAAGAAAAPEDSGDARLRGALGAAAAASGQPEGSLPPLPGLPRSEQLPDDAMFWVLGFGLVFFVVILVLLRRSSKALRRD
ncbi:unnamed protein product [Prorocentrum cordatum]|uniref:Uncharacterized protein n=1 Tax=Prorocentrum cordatum TaxID=2364126 RepID=A0ABN9W7N7_9DINO|nr:unnamed protein product [Polarella glacialis]